MVKNILLCALSIIFLFFLTGAAPNEQTTPGVTLLDHNGTPITQLTDGDVVQLQIKLRGAVDQPTPISFSLDPDIPDIANCTVAKADDTCRTQDLFSLGWFWSKQGQAQPTRTIRASSTALTVDTGTTIQVKPRPVVFVHGFGSSAAAWTNYLGANGYLAPLGLRGFAVGDGQVPGTLNLGNLANPSSPTKTIGANAEILRDYIAGVKQATGASMVDLVAHSMGNLVSRYYIDRVMSGRDVAQMIMLGPPNDGTDCALLPASLGLYLPAVLQLRPSYIRTIFNPQITRRHGIPFTVIAGTPIVNPVTSPCTSVPSDLAIALESASGIRAPVVQADALHTDLNTSEQVFAKFVKPLLQKSVGQFPNEPDPAPVPSLGEELQFTNVITGHVSAGSSTTETINIDNVTVASFALFDPTRSLTVTVRGATGNVIALDPTRNGLVVVQDPATLVYLGYGFANPHPGPWQVTLQSTDVTPNTGADFAITAHLQGGAVLNVQTSTLFPMPDEPVTLSARLELAGQDVAIRDGQARIRYPSGELRTFPLTSVNGGFGLMWQSAQPGLYGVDIGVNGSSPDGTPIERTAFLSLQVQPPADQFQNARLLAAGVIVALVAAVVALFVVRRRYQKS